MSAFLLPTRLLLFSVCVGVWTCCRPVSNCNEVVNLLEPDMCQPVSGEGRGGCLFHTSPGPPGWNNLKTCPPFPKGLFWGSNKMISCFNSPESESTGQRLVVFLCMYFLLACFFLVLFCFCFLGLHLRHMEVPRLGVESELQLVAYATATATTRPGPLTPCARPGIEPASAWILVRFVSTEPQQEFLFFFLFRAEPMAYGLS